MELKALSHYDGDLDTRFGDCMLLYDSSSLIVYDCGHTKHTETVETFLQSKTIKQVHIVVSHNDNDHTSGICELLEWLYTRKKYSVSVYSHQYLKHVDTILDKIDDGRRNRESLKRALLAEFDNIKEIIKTAQACGFAAEEALIGIGVGNCTIVGPTEDEFTDVAARAVDNRVDNNIGEGYAEETVMNAASIQIKCKLDNADTILLCGDSSPMYMYNLDNYDIIQLPHHGQLADAEAVFSTLTNAGSKVFLVSDNTGSAKNSGGSYDLMESDAKKGKRIKNTKNGIVELPDASVYCGGGSKLQAASLYRQARGQVDMEHLMIFCKSRDFLGETEETLNSHVSFVNSVFGVEMRRVANVLNMVWFITKEHPKILYMAGHTGDALNVINWLHSLCECGVGTQIRDIYLNTCTSKPDSEASRSEITATSGIVFPWEANEDEKKRLAS